jgi:iron(III) transport system substrate-binding protein
MALFVAALAACSPAPSPAPPSPTQAPAPAAKAPTSARAAAAKAETKGDSASAATSRDGWQGEWDKTLAAAKQEGKLTLITHPGTDYRRLVELFQEKYPDIKVEHTGARPSDISPKVIAEQQNGVFSWDVMTASTSNMINVLAPTGAFIDLRTQFLLPDAMDGSKWAGGFESWAHDVTNQTFVFVHAMDVVGGYSVNRDVVPKGEVTSIDDLLDPKYRGKIVLDDPSVPAHGSLSLTGFLFAKGEDWVKRLFNEQKPTIQDNVRVTTEWISTGRYPLAVGVDKNFLLEFQKEGIGKTVDFQQGPLYLAARGVGVFKNSPHPNASKVWVNWLLTREGQMAWAEAMQGNSRRTDVPVLNQAEYPDFSKLDTYASPNTERGKDLLGKIFGIYKQYQANQ